jgi:nucleotide-binding universal stress UspA family protein
MSEGMRPIQRILVATDFSPCADEAARDAFALAERLGASVTLLQVVQMPIQVISEVSTAPLFIGDLVALAYEELKGLIDRLKPTVHVESRVEEGPPAATIARLAQEGEFDLIVLGTHGRTGIKRAVMGSVAEHVVRSASVPVMTVHAPARGG